jgi:hypothetical protein
MKNRMETFKIMAFPSIFLKWLIYIEIYCSS